MKTKLVILLLFIFSNVYSQSYFRDGYLITNDNDTIFGQIDNGKLIINPFKIKFRSNLNSEIQNYSPEDIYGYRFNDGQFYISKQVEMNSIENIVFLEYLVEGIVNLYYLYDELTPRYFIENENGLYELRDDQKEILAQKDIFSEYSTYIKKSNQYIGVLRYILSDAPELRPKVDQAVFNHKSLMNLTEDYHNYVCDDEKCLVYKKKKEIGKTKIGIKAGMTHVTTSNNISFYSNLTRRPIEEGAFDPSTSYDFGIFVNQELPFNYKNLSLQYEISFNAWELNEKIEQKSIIRDYEVTQQALNNELLFKIEFPIAIIEPNIQLGGFYKHFFNYKCVIISTDNNKEDHIRIIEGEEELNVNYFQKYDAGLAIGLGTNIKITNNYEISVDARYHLGIGIHKGELRTKTFVVYIGIPIFNI